jgi:hypothetical protein
MVNMHAVLPLIVTNALNALGAGLSSDPKGLHWLRRRCRTP